jgi:integrase
VRAVLDRELDAGRERACNKLLVIARRLFSWAQDRGMIENNPAAGIRKPGLEQSRDRVLANAELSSIWTAAGELGPIWCGFIRLLIATGLRRSEISRLKWSEVDLERKVLVLAGTRTKSGKAIEAPLNTLAIETIKSLPRIVEADGDGWLFPSRHAAAGTPISGFNKLKAKLDTLSGVQNWRLHDLRRTAAAAMAKAGIALPVLSRVLHHSPGPAMAGVLAIYARYEFDREAAAALEVWSRELERVIGRGGAKVVAIR